MVTDKKLVNMYESCRKHKRQLDKKRYAVRMAMFMPPALTCILIFISYIMSAFSDFVIAILGGFKNGSSINALCFIHVFIMTIFIAGETILENKHLISISNIAYPVASITAIIPGCIFLFAGDSPNGALFLSFSVFYLIMSAVNIFFKRLYEENEMLKTLDGYPHFNVMLLLQNEEDGNLVPRKSEEEIARMTPDEKIMYERGKNL